MNPETPAAIQKATDDLHALIVGLDASAERDEALILLKAANAKIQLVLTGNTTARKPI